MPARRGAASAGLVAGCRVATGSISKGARYRVLRKGVAITEGLVDCSSIRRHRLDVETVGKGTECGVVLSGWQGYKSGDVLQCVRLVRRRARTVSVMGGGVRVSEGGEEGGRSDDDNGGESEVHEEQQQKQLQQRSGRRT